MSPGLRGAHFKLNVKVFINIDEYISPHLHSIPLPLLHHAVLSD